MNPATAVSPATTRAPELAERHGETLAAAVDAIGSREYWSAYSELPRTYGEEAEQAGREAFEGYRDAKFELDQPSSGEWVGDEHSPYGFALETKYPHADADALVAAATAALPSWRDAGAQARVGVGLEILARLNDRSHEIAHAVQHTTGQAYMMAFQAGGPHAQDRALEAIAYAHQAMAQVPATALWEKPQGKRPPLRVRKRFTVAPRGVAAVIGCSTFPTWNGYPGLFASLVTGNPVIVKPSRRAILPLAITVKIARDVLAEAGFSPDIVTLAVEGPDERLASVLVTQPEVRLIDYTGSSEFGEWIEREANQAVTFTEKAGVNCIIVDSTDDYRGVLGNLAFTLSLYSGQMCTTTQNIYLPRDGIDTDDGPKSFDAFATDLATAIEGLLSDPARATAILGAIGSDALADRADSAGELGRLVLASRTLKHPDFPQARVRTPALVAVDDPDDAVTAIEHFGPVALLVATDDTATSIAAFKHRVSESGAITAGVYSTAEDVLTAAEAAALDAGVALSCNLTGALYVNQSAAFSDFHATGLNPAANASLTDLAFVAPRFHVVQSRTPIGEEENA